MKYINRYEFDQSNIELKFQDFTSPVYPSPNFVQSFCSRSINECRAWIAVVFSCSPSLDLLTWMSLSRYVKKLIFKRKTQ